MTLEAQGVEAAPEVETQEASVEVAVVEDTPTEGANDEASNDAETPDVPELTVEQKLENAEREAAGKQKKIDRQTAANRKTQENYEKQRQENEKLLQLIEKQTPDTEPTLDNYETHDEYVNALVDYRSKAAVATQQQEMLRQQEAMQQQQVEQERFKLKTAQEVEFMADNPMYKASATEVDVYVKTIESSDATQDAVLTQMFDGNVPAVINYFGSNNGENLDELGEIARMSPPQAAVAIYKIQQKLGSNPTRKETKSAPRPVKVTKATGTGSKPLSKRSGSEISDWLKSK